MSDFTHNSPQYKNCKNGTNCLHPDGPYLPLSEFYQRVGAADGYYTTCKKCYRSIARNYKSKPRGVASWSSEARAIDKLRSLGIYAAPGKTTEWPKIDMAAWGCVRIEVKTAKMVNGNFRFELGHKTAERWKAHDLVMLVCLWPDGDPSYHIFDINDPVFWRGGQLKSGVQYRVNGKHRKKRWYETMTVEKMEAHRDNWQLIEQVRNQKAAARDWDVA